MTSDPTSNGFDSVRFMRETRDRISAEIKDMSWPELRRWLDTQRPDDPFLAAAWDRKVPPTGGERPRSQADQDE